MAVISVVIPCRNGADTIGATLDSVSRANDNVMDVVVVDDGSDDETGRVVAEWSLSSSLIRQVRLERLEPSNRARARNRGAALSRGDHLLFIDSAWRLEPGLMGAANEHLDGRTVVLVPFARRCDQQARKEPFDPRWGYIEATQGNVMKLQCPWLLGWTGAIFIPRDAFDAVNGFDEDFSGWGAEDIELAFRLHQFGLQFWALMSHFACRTGQAQSDADRPAQLRANVARMHKKHCCLETEVLNHVGQLFATSLVERLEQLPLSYIVQECEDEALACLRSQALVATNSLLACPSPALAECLKTSHVVVPSRSIEQTLKNRFPSCTVLRLLGAAVPFETQSFDVAFMTDVVRVVPTALMIAALRELVRVAKKSCIVCSVRDTPCSVSIGRPAFREAAGWQLCTLETLNAIAASAGIGLTAVYRSHYTIVYELVTTAERLKKR